MRQDDDYDKVFELEPTEFRHHDAPEPFLGFNGKYVLILFVAGFPIAAVATWLVTGQFPYWVQPVLELLSPSLQ